ncbi:hypothetical protein [Helicobacter kayseriensis]|uniref:hypothetical protein n=1 Tax=Helicobacter kayseriensis TaxID=2905877 RepID=UPI001E52E5F1|nr:hypothetical protein [Helicobacter kayseriensis]MCE3047634.1 hypothetical protein [Helicobacter kayseriensis]MCE3049014.1 hypothetical protein [Helicobacter kayseriensis]
MKKSEFDKLLISKSKEGRSDGAYSRLFGDNELGALISRIHATSISAGTYLENAISEIASQLSVNEIPNIFNATLSGGAWIVSKKNLKKYVTPYLNLEKPTEPDFLIVDSLNQKCIVLELKDGDNFDTKKAQGEVLNLKKYSDALNGKLAYPWVSRIGVCMFNQEEHKKIVEGFKGHIEEKDAITGSEFCMYLGLDKNEINSERQKACNQNFHFFIDEILKIEAIRNILKSKLE